MKKYRMLCSNLTSIPDLSSNLLYFLLTWWPHHKNWQLTPYYWIQRSVCIHPNSRVDSLFQFFPAMWLSFLHLNWGHNLVHPQYKSSLVPLHVFFKYDFALISELVYWKERITWKSILLTIRNWLTVLEYLFHKWQQICSKYRL